VDVTWAQPTTTPFHRTRVENSDPDPAGAGHRWAWDRSLTLMPASDLPWWQGEETFIGHTDMIVRHHVPADATIRLSTRPGMRARLRTAWATTLPMGDGTGTGDCGRIDGCILHAAPTE